MSPQMLLPSCPPSMPTQGQVYSWAVTTCGQSSFVLGSVGLTQAPARADPCPSHPLIDFCSTILCW